ncbi:hypothetical protein BS78_02G145200 [Paspalum vaginatum]|nr:hypothetical protein BS78_02G145200 [Paspalum vaginatum]
MYSGARNVMLMVEIEDRLHDLKQGERSVMEYIAELKSLWADADHCKPIELPHSEVIQFLRGLNSEFEARRSSIFHQPTLPSLEEAIAAISQEEYKLKVMRESTTSSPSCPIFAATRVEDRQCFNCGRERGNSRGALRGGRGRGGRGGYRANVASTQGELSEACEASLVEVEEPRQVKGKYEGNYAHASIPTQISKLNWILDSGASKHVTGTSSEFDSYIQYPPTRKETIQTADGTSQPIRGVGTVQCTPSIKLLSLLHVPAFPVNLVSLSALVDQLDCRVILDRENCLI